MTTDEIEQIRSRTRAFTARKVAEETGLSLAWVQKFRRGRIKNPGVLTLATLVSYLNQQRQEG